jgi:hypothetical protein
MLREPEHGCVRACESFPSPPERFRMVRADAMHRGDGLRRKLPDYRALFNLSRARASLIPTSANTRAPGPPC